MTHVHRPAEVAPEILDDVVRVVGARAGVVSRLPGGINEGAVRVELEGRADGVLKAVPRTGPDHLAAALRARRVVERMRERGYPTPAWLGVGATATHVWHLTDFVDAVPVRELTPPVVEQLMEIVELQSGQASEPPDHGRYAWRVATGREPSVTGLSGYSRAVSDLMARLPAMRADAPLPRAAPDMVHADLNPSNVLVREGVVMAVVDIDNAGSGTRATDLTTLRWYTDHDRLDGVRRQLWMTSLDLVGQEWTGVLTTTQILLQLEWPIRLELHHLVPAVVERGHRMLDELDTLC